MGLYAIELFPTKLRSTSMGSATAITRLVSFLSAFEFPYIALTLGELPFFEFLVIVTFLGFIWTIFCTPETKLNEVVFALAQRVDPQRDVVVIPGAHVDVLDTGSPTPGYGSKLGIDATRKLPEEYGGRSWPEEVEPDPEVSRKISETLRSILQ